MGHGAGEAQRVPRLTSNFERVFVHTRTRAPAHLHTHTSPLPHRKLTVISATRTMTTTSHTKLQQKVYLFGSNRGCARARLCQPDAYHPP
jgi:hypothetical protein